MAVDSPIVIIIIIPFFPEIIISVILKSSTVWIIVETFV